MPAKPTNHAEPTSTPTSEPAPTPPPANPIATLNDAFRRSCRGGTFVATRGVTALGHGVVAQIVALVRSYDRFTEDNDPYGEHDFGSIEWHGIRLFWKIDCYDVDLRYASPDPADPSVTARVLTLMLAEDY